MLVNFYFRGLLVCSPVSSIYRTGVDEFSWNFGQGYR